MNPTKSVLGIEEGKILGHIINKDGFKIDPERIEAIRKIPLPKNVKALQCFNGHINFIRRFIPNLAELMKPMQALLKKNAKFVWTSEGREAFGSIKNAITKSPVLVILDYSKEFMIFSFASKDTIAGALLQKKSEGFEQPIAFMSRALQDSQVKYTIMEK